jgi:hypothetical protein
MSNRLHDSSVIPLVDDEICARAVSIRSMRNRDDRRDAAIGRYLRSRLRHPLRLLVLEAAGALTARNH